MLLRAKVSTCLTDEESGSVAASLSNESMRSIVGITLAMVETWSWEKKRVASLYIWYEFKEEWPTLRTRKRSLIIFQSSSWSSNLRSFKDLLAVMSSIAERYLSATFAMSKVEFQRVFTSRGMRRMGSLWVVQVVRCHVKFIYVQNQSDPQIGLTSGCSWVSRNTLDFVDNYFFGLYQ